MNMTSKMEVLVSEGYDSECKARLFDYSSGELSISIKCNRCGRVLRFKNCTEKYFRNRSLYGQIHI